MCGNTKQRIADALRQLMTEKSFDKITVRNLMDATNMKRQSFYYHFQDTRDVLMWICRQNFIDPLCESRLEFVDWVMLALQILAGDRSFYRRLLAAACTDFVTEFDERVMLPRMAVLLYPGAGALSDNQRFVVRFTAQAFTARLIQFVDSPAPLDANITRERIEFLLRELHIAG